MKTRFRTRLTIFAILLIAILGMTAISTEVAFAKSDLIRLTVINNSQFDFILYLYGPEEYHLTVPPNSSDKLFIERNEYEYLMEVCNYAKTGEFNLTIFQTLHIPTCGGSTSKKWGQLHHIDISQIVKPVRVTIRNKTGEAVGVYVRTQEYHHFLNFEVGEIKQVILRKDKDMPEIQYVYSFQACDGQLVSGYFTPRVTPPLDLKCP